MENKRIWYILNFIAPAFSRQKTIGRIVEWYNDAYSANLEYFAPTFVEMEKHDGRWVRKERPLIFHYVFVRGMEAEIKQLCAPGRGLSFVVDKTGTSRHLTLSDTDMESFRRIAQAHSNNLPCFSPADIALEEGDLVEIVSGELSGVRGRYISRRGSNSGQICISLTDSLCAMVADVRADYVKVIEFARGTKRGYDQLDAHLPRLFRAIDAFKAEGRLSDPSLISPLIVFTRRFGEMRASNPKFAARLAILLYASYSLLGDEKNARQAMETYRKHREAVTNPWMQSLDDYLTGTITGDDTLLREAAERVATLPATTTHRRTLLDRLPR